MGSSKPAAKKARSPSKASRPKASQARVEEQQGAALLQEAMASFRAHPSVAVPAATPLIPCRHGSACYDHSAEHRGKYSHIAAAVGSALRPCRFGAACYDHSTEHRARFSHPTPPSYFHSPDHGNTWEPYDANTNALISFEMASQPDGGVVALPGGLPFEVRWGSAASSSKMRKPPPTHMMQVNTSSGNSRWVKAADGAAAASAAQPHRQPSPARPAWPRPSPSAHPPSYAASTAALGGAAAAAEGARRAEEAKRTLQAHQAMRGLFHETSSLGDHSAVAQADAKMASAVARIQAMQRGNSGRKLGLTAKRLVRQETKAQMERESKAAAVARIQALQRGKSGRKLLTARTEKAVERRKAAYASLPHAHMCACA